MNFIGLWVQGIAGVVFAAAVVLCGWGMHKKFGWKKYEFLVVVLFAAVILTGGAKNFYRIARPQIETQTMTYIYTNGGMVFGRSYCFRDAQGNVYDIKIDPVTWREIVKPAGIDDFQKDESYTISYEKQSGVILQAEKVSGETT